MRRLPASFIFLLLLALARLMGAPDACPAAASWQIRTFPSGSGSRIETVPPSSFYVIGDFVGSREWVSMDGGTSGSIRNPGPPFAADSVVSFSAALDRQGAVTRDGSLWLGTRDGRTWDELNTPDTLGTPSAVFCRQGDVLWVGTREGVLLRVDPSAAPAAWTRSASLGDAPVDRILPSGDDRLCVLLADGSLFARSSSLVPESEGDRGARADSAWIAAPFRASQFDMTRTGNGYAIERASLVLWKTADAGMTWIPVNGALAEPRFAPWAAQARRLLLRPEGFGVIACGDLLLATADEGDSWRIAASGAGMFLDAAFDGFGDLVTVGERIHRSTDRANSMVQILGGDFSRVVMGSISTGWACDRGLLLSVNQGERWLRQPIPDSAERLAQIAARGDYEIWLHFDGEGGPRTYHSGNRGATYDEIDSPGALRGLRGWSFPEPGIGWAWADSAILRSSNGGFDWLPVHAAPEAITAMAVRDSLDAVFASQTRFMMTRDGGRTWEEWESPRAAAVRCLCWREADRFVAAGQGIAIIEAESGGEEIAQDTLGDTIRSVVLAADGSGWASGDGGILAGTTDGGASWSPYQVNLELNAFRGDLTTLSMIDPDHAATGSSTSLIRLLPDATGPIFRYGVSANPYLPGYLDIHVTARERLQGDSLVITIDGQGVPSELFDPGGFLYRAHYHVPSGSGERRMITRARDWTGNERVDTRFLGAVALDGAGEGRIAWGSELLAIRGDAMGAAGLLELIDEIPPFPDEGVWRAAGSPFQLAADNGLAVIPLSPAAVLALWESAAEGDPPGLPPRGEEDRRPSPFSSRSHGPAGSWRILPASSMDAIASGSILLILRDGSAPAAAGRDGPLLRIFPLPARDACTIEWSGPLASPFRWELFDLSGRLLTRGEAPPPAARILRVPTRDAGGRDLPSGIYWIRVQEGPVHAVRRIAVIR